MIELDTKQKRALDSLAADVKEILCRYDPLGNHKYGNLYITEADELARRLLVGSYTHKEILIIIYAVFVEYWFADYAGEPADYVDIAREIWALKN